MLKVISVLVLLMSPYTYIYMARKLHYWALDQLRSTNYPTVNEECEYCEGECRG